MEEKWFGAGQRPKSGSQTEEEAAVKPFEIHFGEDDLRDLKARIGLDRKRLTTRHAEPLEGAAFDYGFNGHFLTEAVASYWMEKYDWIGEQKRLNAFPQFTTSIDGLDVHFVHVKPDPVASKAKTVLPLLMVHGWPGSFVEFVKIIPLLTAPRDDQDFVFEIIAPSIPGYGFSSAPKKTGFHFAHCANIFRKLMHRLGHPVFYAQGGDWGSAITTSIATLYPETLHGLHLNMAVSQTPSATFKLVLSNLVPWLMLDKKDYRKVIPMSEKFGFLLAETGYMHIQGTKPDTVGVGLNTSPLGLAAYIIEKFSTWTNREYKKLPDGGLTKKFTMDDLLNNVMIYWISGSITSSMRFYAESLTDQETLPSLNNAPTYVPTGVSALPEEIFVQPKSFLSGKFKNIISYTDLERGGHFAAYEEPALLADDVIQFVKQVEKLRASKTSKSEL